MPVRQMTQEEKEEIFGNGVVIFGMKQPSNSETNSSKSDSKQNLPEKIETDSHDEWLTSQSDEQLHNLVRNLGPLLQKSLKTESDEASPMENLPTQPGPALTSNHFNLGMFEVPDGAKVWAVDATPVLELEDGSLVFATEPDRAFPSDVFRNNASRADAADMAFWEKRYASSKILEVDRSGSN